MEFRNILFVIVTFTFLSSYPCQAQNTPQEEAMQLYNDGRYQEALTVFKRLVTLFPKDPRYQYYCGVCMVQSNTELIKAVEYLKFAADRSVPRDVYYFLGKACHYLYRFDDALDAYLRFQQFGERAEKDRWQCDMHINMARNGKRLLEKQAILKVYRVDTLTRKGLFGFYNHQIKNGKFKEKSEKTFPFSDSKATTTWSFIPSLIGKDQEVFESSPVALRKNRDLVITKKLDEDKWSRPENLGMIINSPFDEDYGYFNTCESVLYFASKGHNSMGGYDIFKSAYNPDTKAWSEPVNLGYPINTPYDDFLFVPSEDQTKAWFASNRETKGDELRIYTIAFPLKQTNAENPVNYDYVSKSHLKQSPADLPPPPVVYTPVSKKTVKPQADIKPAPQVVIKKTSIESYPAELSEHKEYNELLNAALQYQIQSDSLSRAAENIRPNLLTTRSEAEKEKWKREIYLLEQHSKAAQIKADELYDKARVIEVKYAANNDAKTKTNTSGVTDEMARSTFNPKNEHSQDAASEKKQGKVKVAHDEKAAKGQKINTSIIYEFRIMSKTPYKSASDIPVNKPLPDGILYRIQMGAFSKSIEADRFKGIMPINGETLQNGLITKYYAGMFSRMSDAEKALNKIREYGFKDAYIVSFFDGKSIPINRAKELERDYQ